MMKQTERKQKVLIFKGENQDFDEKKDRHAVSGKIATFPVIRWVRSLGGLRYPLDGT